MRLPRRTRRLRGLQVGGDLPSCATNNGRSVTWETGEVRGDPCDCLYGTMRVVLVPGPVGCPMIYYDRCLYDLDRFSAIAEDHPIRDAWERFLAQSRLLRREVLASYYCLVGDRILPVYDASDEYRVDPTFRAAVFQVFPETNHILFLAENGAKAVCVKEMFR